ncbi:site-specific integrase [Clostridium ihumii]|uniref:site-specific integrase n=1 Tax=Clostridium ihumii TaxID=1470356 RepID=UPI00058DFFA9|nr:site-specific integrase [Clostridium ihumii]
MQGSVRKRGSTWSYYFNLGVVDGVRKRKEKGGFKTKKEAQQALRIALNEFESCGSVIDESNISISDYFDYWYKEYVLINCKYNTQEYYKNIIKNHIKPSLGSYKLKSLTPAILQEFINNKYLDGFSKCSINNFYGVLSGALKSAVYPYQFIKENPMKYIKLPKDNKPKSEDLKIISINDFNTIINRFPQGSSFYIPLQIAFHTGMRASEVCGLTWDCIDFENKTIHVEKILLSKKNGVYEFGSPKTKSSNRFISIGDTLILILKNHNAWQKENKLKYDEYYINSNFVCTKENGETVTTNSLKYLSRVVNYELNINFNFHSLRHTHATMLLEAGANIKDIQVRLGHSKLSTTMDIYSHVTKKMKEDSVNIFESLITK